MRLLLGPTHPPCRTLKRGFSHSNGRTFPLQRDPSLIRNTVTGHLQTALCFLNGRKVCSLQTWLPFLSRCSKGTCKAGRRAPLLFPPRDEDTAAGPEARASGTGRERSAATQSTDTPRSTYYVLAPVSGNGKAPEHKKEQEIPARRELMWKGGKTDYKHHQHYKHKRNI